MKLIKIALCAAVASAALAGAAAAQDLSFNAGVTTEYVFRGQAQASDAGFGGVDYGTSDWYVGAWGSTVDFGPSAEVDLYAGWTPSFGGADVDLGVVYYAYVNDPNTYTNYSTGLADPGIDAAYLEFIASASVPVGMASIGGTLAYSPDFFAEAGDAVYYEANFAFPWREVEFSGAVGVQTIDNVQAGPFSCAGAACEDEYTTWNFGFSFPVADRLLVDLRYHDTDDDGFYFGNTNLAGVAYYDGVLVGTLTATFP